MDNPHLKIRRTYIHMLRRVYLCFLLISGSLPIPAAIGVTLTWDANGTVAPNPSDGSGTWLTANDWWNGSANGNGVWTGSTPDNAVFGAGTTGSYTVTVGSVSVSNVTFNTSGYTLAGGLLTLGSSGTTLSSASGVDSTINSTVTSGSGTTTWNISAGASLTLGGGGLNSGSTLIWTGGGTINITNGTYTPGVFWLQNITNMQSGGSISPASTTFIGYAGNTTYTINGNDASLNVSGIGPILGRGSSRGVLNLQNGSVTTAGLYLGYDSSSSGILNQSGGTLTVPIGKILYLNYGSIASGGKGILNLSGGILNAYLIQFGGGSGAYNAGSSAALNVSGGILYLNTGGLILNPAGPIPGNNIVSNSISLTGGTIAASADWTTSLPMQFSTTGSNVTFQAADSGDMAHNISLTGILSGPGGLIKTDLGILTLGATNTYSGPTILNGGTLLLGGSVAKSSSLVVSNSGVFTFVNSSTINLTNRLNDSAPITVCGGTLNFLNDGSAADFSEMAGTLNISSGENVINVYAATNGFTSTVIFNSLSRSNGTVDFEMGEAGTPQNRVFFTIPPSLGNWITVNGEAADYDPINGLHSAASIYTDIAAYGSTISTSPSSNVRINSVGSGNLNIQLESTTTQINSLQQNTSIAATVDTTGKSLLLNRITVNAGSPTLNIGMSSGSGALAAETVGGNLVLENLGNSANGLIINAAIIDNGASSTLTVLGTGTVLLAATNNSYSGGTTISNGTLALTAGTTAPMSFTTVGGTLRVLSDRSGATVAMTRFSASGNKSGLAFDLKGTTTIEPLVTINGDMTLNGDVRIGATNLPKGSSVLLRYTGTRSGAGRFLSGNLPGGAGIIDDRVNKQVNVIYFTGPTAFVPTHDTNQYLVAVAIPQQYGAVGDGLTDDSAAFQSAMSAVNNPTSNGGGVVYVPSGIYCFSNSITIPPGVTLQGDWADWSQGSNGVVGTLFKVYAGAGQSNGASFITINQGALKGISIWYPDQDPANIIPYPFTVSMTEDTAMADVALINSYQGILAYSAAKHVISRVFGSPLYTGIQVDSTADISHQEDVRFSPEFWSLSMLPGAPDRGGPQALWMHAHGVAERLYYVDGEACMDVQISGYKTGVSGQIGYGGGVPNFSFYGGYISNCVTAFLDTAGGGNTGQEFTDIILDGDTGIDRGTNNDASAYFHSCHIIGHNGVAIRQTGGPSSTIQFQCCDVNGTVSLDGGIANFVNCSFTVSSSSNHCVMAPGAIYAGFTGCIFNPVRKISNSADPRRLVMDGRRAISSPLPVVNWSDIRDNLLSYRPAKLDVYPATTTPWLAAGDGVTDDTIAIQNTLNTAGANGGGIVYLPPGKYKITGTLDVPSGVELRGSFPSRHPTGLFDGHVKVTLLQPYGGAGTTNGPPAIALESNSGVVGLTITYEAQDTNATPYPPTIQGRGANIYADAIRCPNAYWYVDLNTYTCSSHYLQNVDGCALKNGFVIGNGSSGSIVQCHANFIDWLRNTGSSSQLTSGSLQTIVSFAQHNLEWFKLGDCTEYLIKDFDIFSHTFMHCIDQNGHGPSITAILTMVDGGVEDFRFEAAASCDIKIVNPEWMVSLQPSADLTSYGVISTPSFQGKVRFFNAPLWGNRNWDYFIQGGDVGFELTHAGYLSGNGSVVSGGVVHFVNCSFEGNSTSYYTVPFNSVDPGVPGKLSEIIGCYSWTGWTFTRANANNPINFWGNFGINNLVTQQIFNVSPPTLLAAYNASNMTISFNWTNNMGAFDLYQTENLGSGSGWTITTNEPYFENNCWTQSNSTDKHPTVFYRLSQ